MVFCVLHTIPPPTDFLQCIVIWRGGSRGASCWRGTQRVIVVSGATEATEATCCATQSPVSSCPPNPLRYPLYPSTSPPPCLARHNPMRMFGFGAGFADVDVPNEIEQQRQQRRRQRQRQRQQQRQRQRQRNRNRRRFGRALRHLSCPK